MSATVSVESGQLHAVSRTEPPAVVGWWISSAALVTIARFFHPAAPGYDLGIQFQAAQNLLAGQGLSQIVHLGKDLTDPATTATMTHFPAGYSLVAACLLALHLDVGMVVRVTGATATVLGWWGWGALSQAFLREGLTRDWPWRWAASAIAVGTPLLFTPSWSGTDILLWACVPWVIVALGKAGLSKEHPLGYCTVVGAICGVAFQARYAGLFLGLYSAVVIVWQSRGRLQAASARLFAFAVGFAPFLGVQLYVNYIVAMNPRFYDGLVLTAGGRSVLGRFASGIRLLPTAHYPWAFWIPGQALQLLVPDYPKTFPWQLAITVIAFYSLFLSARAFWSGHASSSDSRVLALGLLIVIPIELWACTAVGSYTYLGDRRYYWPALPLAVLLCYSIGSMLPRSVSTLSMKLLVRGCVLYVLGFVVLTAVYVAFIVAPGRIGTSERQKVFGGDSFKGWPSLALTWELSPARQFVVRRLQADPEMFLVTSRAGWFYADTSIRQTRVFELYCNVSRVAGPARILILSLDRDDASQLWWAGGSAGAERAACYERLPNLTVLQRFPDEGLKVIESYVQAGEHIVLTPDRP